MGGVDSHHVPHKALSVPPPDRKGVFREKGEVPAVMWWPSYPAADGLRQLNGLCGRQSLYVCVSAAVVAAACVLGWRVGGGCGPRVKKAAH